MPQTARTRFIWTFTVSYALLALGWIFLSDRLLSMFADIPSMVWLSTVKGVFFVAVTAAAFFFALRSVPAAGTETGETLIDALTNGITNKQARWPFYVFAVVVSLSTIVLRLSIATPVTERPMLVLFVLPMILSALVGGFGPGLLATALVGLSTDYYILPPLGQLSIAKDTDLLQWCMLLLSGIAVSVLSGMLRVAVARAQTRHQLLDAVISSTSDAIFVKDLQGRYRMVNLATARFVGKPIQDILGRDDSQLLPPDSAQTVMEADRVVMQADHPRNHEEHLTFLDGSTHHFSVTKGPVRDTDGRTVGMFGISRDITEEKRVAQQVQHSEQRLARVIEGTEQGYWDWNLETNQFDVSARWEQMLGFEPGEMNVATANWSNLVQADDLKVALESVRAHCAGERPLHEAELRMRTKSGGWRWILTRGRIVERDADGKPRIMSGTHTDITERKQFELAQREASTVFASSSEGIMVVSPQMRIVRINPAFTRITGYEADDIVGKSPSVLSSGQQDRAFYRAMWEALNQHHFWSGEIWNRRKSGELYAELLSISAVQDAHGTVQHYVGVFSDISQLKAHEAELERIAHYDPLTGLPNRRLLNDRLEQALARANRSASSLAVCYLDLDGFKTVNDNHGHAAGDALLVGVAENLHHVLRLDDTLARTGGDEFVLLLSDVASPEECSTILDRVLRATTKPVALDGHMLSISASIGVSLYPADHSDADTLLRHADQAMVLAKEAGKNQFHLFDPTADRLIQEHRQILETLRNALDHNEFVLHFQPKVDLRDSSLIGVEALIRWQHPERGLLPPGEFLRHLDGTDLEIALGEWVIRQALHQGAMWSRQGHAIAIGINVSAAHLLHRGFWEYLRTELAQHPDMPADRVELEVLETAALADLDQATEVLHRCRQLGVHFALDDFGTGYSSLTYLRKLPVDVLKIDQSFIRDMLVDPDDLGIVEGVIRLATAFNRKVIAEGVETMEHGAALMRLGCHLAQGYGIARPMPAEDLLAWLARWRSEHPAGLQPP